MLPPRFLIVPRSINSAYRAGSSDHRAARLDHRRGRARRTTVGLSRQFCGAFRVAALRGAGRMRLMAAAPPLLGSPSLPTPDDSNRHRRLVVPPPMAAAMTGRLACVCRRPPFPVRRPLWSWGAARSSCHGQRSTGVVRETCSRNLSLREMSCVARHGVGVRNRPRSCIQRACSLGAVTRVT